MSAALIEHFADQMEYAAQIGFTAMAAFLSERFRRGAGRTFAGLGAATAVAGPADTDFRTRPSAWWVVAVPLIHGRAWSAHQQRGWIGHGG